MARRKTKKAIQREDIESDEDTESIDEFDEGPLERKRSQAEMKLKRSKKRQDTIVLVLAVIFIILTGSGYIYYAYVLNPTEASKESEEVITGNKTGALYVISDITHNWTKESWHIMNIQGSTNFLLKVENTGEEEDKYKLSDVGNIERIKIKYNYNNFNLKPGKSTVVIVNVTNTMLSELRVPNPIIIQLKSKKLDTILDSVEIYLTVDILDTNEKAEKGDKVSAYYTGVFENSTIFDYSLRDPQNTQPLFISLSSDIQLDKFSLNQYTTVIPGFKKGIIGMVPGETHTIIIPPELGYPEGQPLSGVTLLFEVRLLSNDKDL